MEQFFRRVYQNRHDHLRLIYRISLGALQRGIRSFLIDRVFRIVSRRVVIFGIYNAVGAAILSAIVLISYIRVNLLSTGIVLGGWDTPIYMWHAKVVIQYGPWYYMNEVVQYPAFYPQLLAFFGHILGSVVLAQRILPVALGILRMVLFSLISYKISNNVHIAGLTAVLTSISVGNLWLVGEYHRNSLAFDLVLITILLVSSSSGKIGRHHYLLVPLLFFLTGGTQFETLGLLSLTLVLSAIITKNWRMLLLSLFSSVLTVGIIVLVFPHWLDWYYLHVPQVAYGAPVQHTYYDLIFWSIGSSALIPIGFLGMFNMYEEVKHTEGRETCLPIFMFCSVILVSALAVLSVHLPTQAVRLILLLPVPIILALGVGLIVRLVRKLLIEVKLEGIEKRSLILLGKGKIVLIIGILSSVVTISGLTYMGSDPYGIHYELFQIQSPLEFTTGILMVPFISVPTYSRIVAVRQYLQSNNLQVPIFMFQGASVYFGDVYRAYIYNEVGEHLAYFGDLTNLIDLQPTVWPPSSNPRPGQDQYNFTSSKFLAMMLGAKEYSTVTPQIYSIKNKSDLLTRPLVYVYPEFYDAPLPSYISTEQFRVEDGMYVIPSVAMIEPLVRLEQD